MHTTHNVLLYAHKGSVTSLLGPDAATGLPYCTGTTRSRIARWMVLFHPNVYKLYYHVTYFTYFLPFLFPFNMSLARITLSFSIFILFHMDNVLIADTRNVLPTYYRFFGF